jgi:hypothetical protein
MSKWFTGVARPVQAIWGILVTLSTISVLFNVDIFKLSSLFWGIILFAALLSAYLGSLRSLYFLRTWGIGGTAFLILYTILLTNDVFDEAHAVRYIIAAIPFLTMIFSLIFASEDQAFKKSRQNRDWD